MQATSRERHGVVGLLLCAAVVCSGCGYTLAGQGSFLPDYIQTIGIPLFENATTVFEIEQTLTQQVVTQFIARQAEGHRRLQIAGLGAAIEPLAAEAIAIHRVLGADIGGDGIGQLDFTTGTLFLGYVADALARVLLRQRPLADENHA